MLFPHYLSNKTQEEIYPKIKGKEMLSDSLPESFCVEYYILEII